MKGFWAVGFLVVALPALAQQNKDWAGYITYSPHNISVKAVVPPPELAWMADQLQHTPVGQTTYLGYHEAHRQMTLADERGVWILELENQADMFHFRAQVDPRTGHLVVEQGVDRMGTSRQADAEAAAIQAVDSLRRARMSGNPFPTMMTSAAPMDDKMMMGSDSAWARLLEGNQRFVSGKIMRPRQSMARLDEVRKMAHPFAAVVACSDSRITPEILFDQGVGDLWVVRTPAEVVGPLDLGGLEFAVDHEAVPYILVLADKGCDFVDLTLKGGDLPSNLDAVAEQIRPAAEAARFRDGDLVDNTVRENALEVVEKLRTTPALAAAIHDGRLTIQAAYYDSDTGKVAPLP